MDIDEKIKTKLKLFQGLRSEEKDKEIFEKVYDLVFEEIVKFLFENLNPKERQKLTEELENQDINNSLKILLKYLSKIENYYFKLNAKIENLLDSLSPFDLENKEN
jgi:hypothetical protein